MMQVLKKTIFPTDEFTRLHNELTSLKSGTPLIIKGAAGSLLAFVAAYAFEQKRQVVLIASDEDRAEKLRDDCSLLEEDTNVFLFDTRSTHHAQSAEVVAPVSQIETLKALSFGASAIVVASPQSIVEKIPPPESFSKSIIEVSASAEYDFQKLIEQLEKNGFERKDFVEGYGDFAVRGGIIDVFPHVGENPLRLEFWGNRIESIREFDALSQRSIRKLKTARIVPSFSSKSNEVEQNENFSSSLFDYLRPDAIVILDSPAEIEREIDETVKEVTENIFDYKEISQRVFQFQTIVHSMIQVDRDKVNIDFDSTSQPSFNGSIRLLADRLKNLSGEGFRIVIASDTKEESARLKELLIETTTLSENDETINQDGNEFSSMSDIAIEWLPQTVHSGFIIPSAKLAVFTEHEVFGRLKRRGLAKRRRFKGFSQKDLDQLKRGDFVVHLNHGIGTFAGLKKIKVGAVEQEVMKLLFLENDVLYVNLNYINRVRKYSSQEGIEPKLNKLGSADWERTKERAKRRVKDIARDLITLYAQRKREKGFPFSSDTHWQKELEASFMYEDTVDQASATLDVKRDMEESSPMDRLICGDVGFGKTEIAVRAAFKAVMDGKQVAILVPTTILALQHSNTFHDRLSRYTTRVENITRFKSAKEQKKIVDELKQGTIDIIIGTHRLLSKDIAFKDLGLLIIDEEHRFGVAAKEKLRTLKASVDTLTLTATPIPRTLHFSLMGARDLSIINTPPRNRRPILTEIIPGDGSAKGVQWRIAGEAIRHELHRGGQVYVVHDRVNNIDAIANDVRSHVPEARVHVAHGQMSGHELEKTMLDFLEKKYNILVCTKIIESGLDISNVNTIIINRADQFGLAELYQLRGRVGRSNVQAYAYLLTPPLNIMPKMTLRRIQAIEEFTELGSGFNLAMRDMEIRGTGNLLGAEQSGFILDMGFDMYERIVGEAIAELREEEFKGVLENTGSQLPLSRSVESVVDTDVEALIPDVFIESDSERLDIYRRLYRASSFEELRMMREELVDRFGEYPEEVDNLFQIVEIRLLASSSGFPKISLQGETLIITLPPDTDEQFYGSENKADVPFQKFMQKISREKRKNIRLNQSGKELTLKMMLPSGEDVKHRLESVKESLVEITQAE